MLCKEAQTTHWFPIENFDKIMPQFAIGILEEGTGFYLSLPTGTQF